MYLKICRRSVSFSIWTSSGTSQSATWIIDSVNQSINQSVNLFHPFDNNVYRIYPLLSCPCSHYTELNLLQFNSCFHQKHVKQKMCCKNYMQFAYYGIINVMENALVFNTVLTWRYVQVQTNFIQYQTDLCVSNELLLQQVLFWYCEHHGNRLLLFSEIMLQTEITVLVFWGTSRSQYSVLLEMVNILSFSNRNFRA